MCSYLRKRLRAARHQGERATTVPGSCRSSCSRRPPSTRSSSPTFVYAYPAEVSPLSRPNDADPFIADRFEFFLAGRELANGFSELNDPEDQAARFRAQVARKDKGDEEAMFYDADYVRALEYGMPPTAGLGVGIDRLVMFFTDSPSIRDVILFPHMRPEAETLARAAVLSARDTAPRSCRRASAARRRRWVVVALVGDVDVTGTVRPGRRRRACRRRC